MNIAPTCPKCLRPYWDDGSQTAVTICKCEEHTLPPPSLIINTDTQVLKLLKEINNKLDELKAIQVEAKVKPACEIDGRIKEAEYWRDQIFSPEFQASKPTISLTDFIFRIEELKASKSV